MSYVKNMTRAGDNATDIDIPQKYKTVVIDGALMWAYKFDPELGNAVDQARCYEYGAGGGPNNIKGGVKGMVLDNTMKLDELQKTSSHRVKDRLVTQPYRVDQ